MTDSPGSHSLVAIFMDNPLLCYLLLAAAIYLLLIHLYNNFKIQPHMARISSTIETFGDLAAGRMHQDMAKVHHFAVLCAEVYGKKQEDGRFIKTWDNLYCQQGDILAQWQQLLLPDSISTVPKHTDRPQSKWDSDLVCGVWYRELPDNTVEAALVFRGTDDRGDHRSNFRWFLRYFDKGWDQYDLTRTVAPEILTHVHQVFAGKKVNMVAAGHSLGGGLAHQAAYAAGIKTVYAFDSSSVTGFYSVDWKTRTRHAKDMRIYRLHERGEILSYLRSIMSLLYPVSERDPQIIRLTYNFTKGGAIGQHSMEDLACALIKVARSS